MSMIPPDSQPTKTRRAPIPDTSRSTSASNASRPTGHSRPVETPVTVQPRSAASPANTVRPLEAPIPAPRHRQGRALRRLLVVGLLCGLGYCAFSTRFWERPSRQQPLASDAAAVSAKSSNQNVPDAPELSQTSARPGPPDRERALQHDRRVTELLELGRGEEALYTCHEALAADPLDPDLYVQRGSVRLELQDLSGALEDFQHALRIDAQHVQAHRALAWALLTAPPPAQRNGPQALQHARLAAEATHHSDPAILKVLALALAETGDFHEARDTLVRAQSLTTDAQLREELTALDRRFRDGKTFPLAEREHDQSTATNSIPSHESAVNDPAAGTSASGAAAKDRTTASAAPAVFPPIASQVEESAPRKTYDQQLQRAERLLQEEQLNEVVEVCGDILRQDPGNVQALSLRSDAHARNENWKAALNDAQRALQLESENPKIYFRRAQLWEDQGFYQRALHDYQEAIRLDPAFSSAWNGLAWLRATCYDIALQDGSEAFQAAQRAGELVGWKSHECFDTLAAAYGANGDFESAVESQQEALRRLEEGGSETRDAYLTRLAYYQQGIPYRSEGVKHPVE